MKRTVSVVAMLALSLLAAVAGQEAKTTEGAAPDAVEEELATPQARLSYAIGMQVGQSLKGVNADIDFAVFTRGVQDVLKGQEPLLTPEEVAQIMDEFREKAMAEMARKRAEQGEKNKEEGEAFLAANGAKENVVTTASGLQYTVLKEGGGATPRADDTVTVHYRGTLLDGTEFDSSYSRGEPATFPLNRVIPGWTEGLQLMKVGSKYRLFVPSDLAYGENGAGQLIGPDAVLIFEVELLKIGE